MNVDRFADGGQRVVVRDNRQMIAGRVEVVGRVLIAVRLLDDRVVWRHEQDVFDAEDAKPYLCPSCNEWAGEDLVCPECVS